MSLFAIGDLHLSLGCDKPMDVFRGWDNYVDRLYNNWNYLVRDGDTVVIAGDVSWGMTLNQAYEDFKFIHNDLNGKKIIIKGNHDYWWSTVAKMNRFLAEKNFDSIRILSNNSYLISGKGFNGVSVCGSRGWINDTGIEFDKKILVREAGRLKMSIDDGIKQGGEIIVFLHYPPIYADEKNYCILDVLQKYNIRRCYYGHIHGAAERKAFVGESCGVEFYLVSSDLVEFTPQLVR
ncbi:MAG: metallophosphoesterase [Eubacterium sp.]|jgi:predicted phosphohydrolase|nr:metallophosphoesterase [Eubacterium sp.]